MSEEILKSLVSAAATIGAAWGAAWINARRSQGPNQGEKKMRLNIILAKRWFVWFVAPLGGALLWHGVSSGLRVHAASVALKVPCCVDNNFYPSGYMGDGEEGEKRIQLNDQWKENCHTTPCVRVSYEPGPKGWAGVYWQYPDKNWGDEPGREIKGAKKLEFWAKGQNGGELVSFKVGGINRKKYQDSVEKSLGPVELTTEWKQFDIDLSDADTSSVIGAFAWVASKNGNPGGVTFYLDDMCFK
jgi:hypothetical protein